MFSEPDAVRRIHAVIAFARNGEAIRRDDAYRALLSIDESLLTTAQSLDLLRAYSLVMVRLGAPEGRLRDEVVSVMDARYPEMNPALDRERGRLLAALDAPGVVAKMLLLLEVYSQEDPDSGVLIGESVTVRSEQYGPTISDMRANMPQPQEIDVVMSLRGVRTGWTLEQRRTYFQWFYDALRRSGGGELCGIFREHPCRCPGKHSRSGP